MGLLDPPASFNHLIDVKPFTIDGAVGAWNKSLGKVTQHAPWMGAMVNTWGHSFNTQGVTSQDRMWNACIANALGGAKLNQQGVGGSSLVEGEKTAGKPTGGWATVAQLMLKPVQQVSAQLATIIPAPGLHSNLTGANDLGNIVLMSGTATLVSGSPVLTGNMATAVACYAATNRAVIAFQSCGVFYEAETPFPSSAINTSFTGASGIGAGSWGTAKTGTTGNSGTGWRETTATNDQIIHGPFTVASRLNGYRYIDLFFLAPGQGGPTTPGSVVTFKDENGTTIYPVGYPQGTPFDTSVVRPTYSANNWQTPYWMVARFQVQAGSGRKIIATAGAGGMASDLIGYEADAPNPIFWWGACQTPGNLGDATKLAIMTAMNNNSTAIVAEFGQPAIQYLDLDATLAYGDPGNLNGFWNTTIDPTHPADGGQQAMAEALYVALSHTPLTGKQSVSLGGGQDSNVIAPVDGVGLTNVPLQFVQTVDGQTTYTGMRVLLLGQTDTVKNGPWVCVDGFNWTRPLDFISGRQVAGKAVFVRSSAGSTIAAGTIYQLVSTTNIICDKDVQTGWTAIGRTAGTGLTLTGNALSISTMATKTVLGNSTGGTAAPTALTTADLAGMFGTPDGTKYLADDGTLKTPSGTGDASTNTATSVDGEAVLFSSTTGKLLKRSTLTGVVKQTSGVAAVATAGTDYLTPGATQTVTATRVTPRVGTTASSATPTANADSHDQYNVTALAAGATFGAPTGTPVAGQKLIYRIKDNGTARSLGYNGVFRALGVTLPTTTVISKTLYIGTIYNFTDTRWDVVAVSQEA